MKFSSSRIDEVVRPICKLLAESDKLEEALIKTKLELSHARDTIKKLKQELIKEKEGKKHD